MDSHQNITYSTPLHPPDPVPHHVRHGNPGTVNTNAHRTPKISRFRSLHQPTTSSTAGLGTATTMNMLVEPRPLLPQPVHILKSQDSGNQCPVCSRFECALLSHKHFAGILNNAAPKVQAHPFRDHTPQTTTRSRSTTPKSKEAHPPAAPYPVLMDTEKEALLKRWSLPFGFEQRGPERHLFPFRFIDVVLPTAMKHAPLFQSILALGASLTSAARGQVDEPAVRHLSIAVQILSQTCPDESSASKDECILAALFVMLTYMIHANTTEANRHMSGINHLVMLRGGPHYLGISGIVAETLLYADYMHAVFFEQPVVWSMPMPALEVGPPTDSGRGFEKMATSGQLDAELVQAAKSLCKLTEIFKQALLEPSQRKSVHAISYLTSISEYQLTHCNTAQHNTASRSECVGLALLLFSHAILRDHGLTTPFVRKIEYQFWTCLQASETAGVWAESSLELLAWVIMTGIVTELRGRCRWLPQAVDRLRHLQQRLRLNSWNEVKARALDDFCWLSAAQEPVLESIWTKEVMKGR